MKKLLWGNGCQQWMSIVFLLMIDIIMNFLRLLTIIKLIRVKFLLRTSLII